MDTFWRARNWTLASFSVAALLAAAGCSSSGVESNDDSSGGTSGTVTPNDPASGTGGTGASSPLPGSGGSSGNPGATGGVSSGTGGTGGTSIVVDGDLPTVTFSDAELMFQDSESIAEFTSEARSFAVGQMLRIRAIDATRIEIANFAPAPVTDAILQISIQGLADDIRFLRVASIPAHGIVEIEYPFVADQSQEDYPTASGERVSLSEFASIGVEPNRVSFDFVGEDGLAKQLADLKEISWVVQFQDFDPGNNPSDNWFDDPEPRHARLWTGLLINMAHLFLHERYQPEFVAEQLYGDDKVDFSGAEKEALYTDILALSSLQLGVVEGVSGLGGPSGMGLANYVLEYYLYIGVEKNAIHVLGFGHSSNMTYSSQPAPFSETAGVGFTTLSKRISDDLWRDGHLPIRQDNYYMPSDHQTACTVDGDCPRYMRCTGTEFSSGMYCE